MLKITDIIKNAKDAIASLKLPGRFWGSPMEKFSIVLDCYDSDFGFLMLRRYDPSKKEFINCGFVPSKKTFKLKRHIIAIPIKEAGALINDSMIFELAQDEKKHGESIVFSSIKLFAGSANTPFAYLLGDISAAGGSNLSPNKKGFSSNYVYGGRNVFAMLAAGRQKSNAYIIFEDITQKAGENALGRMREDALASHDIIEMFLGKSGTPFMESTQREAQEKPEMLEDEPVKPNELQSLPDASKQSTAINENNAEEIFSDIENEPVISYVESNTQTTVWRHSEEGDNKNGKLEEAQRSNSEKTICAPQTTYDETRLTDIKTQKMALAAEMPETGPINAEINNDLKPEDDESDSVTNYFSKDDFVIRLAGLNSKFLGSITQKADSVCNDEYEILGKTFRFEGGPDWHYNFTSAHWPSDRHFKELAEPLYKCLYSPLEKSEGEWLYNAFLSRHCEWVSLALAYKIKKDEKYSNKIIELFNDFKSANKIGYGINYVSAASAAERLINWSYVHCLLKDLRPGEKLIKAGFLERLNEEFKHILSRLNSISGDAAHEILIASSCLYSIAMIYGDMENRKLALPKLFKMFKSELIKQTSEDGGHISSSCGLQLMTYKSVLNAMIISYKRCENKPGSPDYEFSAYHDKQIKERFLAMTDFLTYVSKPDGDIVNFSDNYIHFDPPFDADGAFDIKPFLQIASFLYDISSLKFLTANHKITEIAMLFGEKGIKHFNELAVTIPSIHMKRFEDSGYITSVSEFNSFGHSNAASHIIFDTGRPKNNLMSAEAGSLEHSDTLNFSLSSGGANFICDSGSSFFFNKHRLSDYQKSQMAHNGITLNKLSFDVKSEHFMPEGFREYSLGDITLFSSSHSGYQLAGLDAFVRRTVIFIKPYYVLLLDDVFNLRKKPSYFDVDISFHTPPDITPENLNSFFHRNCMSLNSRRSEAKLILISYSMQKILTSFFRGSLSPMAGWHSQDNCNVAEAGSIICSARFAKLPLRIYSLLYFVNADDSINVVNKKLKMNLNRVSSAIEVIHREFKDHIKINEKFEVEFKRIKM